MAIATGVVGDPHGAAPVTRLPMPAEDGGAAGRDRPERPCWTVARRCVRRYASPCARTMSASSSRGRTRATAVPSGTAHTGQPCGGGGTARADRAASRAHLRVPRQLQVARRRADVPVPEQPLNRVEVDAGFEQVRRERVAQPVNAPGLRDAGAALRRLIRALQRGRIASAARSPRRRKQPRRAGARRFQYARNASSRCAESTVYRSLPALALLDANRHPRRIDVGDAQVEHFVQPQAGRVGRQQHRAMLQIRRVGDHPLRPPRDSRSPGSLPGWRMRRNRERRPVALQRRVVEKPQPVDDDVAGIPRSLSIANQVQEIRLHLLIRNLVGRSVVELGQARDRRQVRSRASAPPSRARPCRHPSVVVAPSSHTSVVRRREHQRSAASIDGLCDGGRRTAGGERRTGTYRDQRFSSTVQMSRAPPRLIIARTVGRVGSI